MFIFMAIMGGATTLYLVIAFPVVFTMAAVSKGKTAYT